MSEKLHKMLAKNANIQAALGTNSAEDVGSDETAKRLWKEMLESVKDTDPAFYEAQIKSLD